MTIRDILNAGKRYKQLLTGENIKKLEEVGKANEEIKHNLFNLGIQKRSAYDLQNHIHELTNDKISNEIEVRRALNKISNEPIYTPSGLLERANRQIMYEDTLKHLQNYQPIENRVSQLKDIKNKTDSFISQLENKNKQLEESVSKVKQELGDLPIDPKLEKKKVKGARWLTGLGLGTVGTVGANILINKNRE